ncbi:MAG TPA: type II secretion system F family protein [Acidimicrobiales bacterium]|jgi:tight adherence protein C|nr:type II secretion system F family protein [Acidimicrobiales bacterium]
MNTVGLITGLGLVVLGMVALLVVGLSHREANGVLAYLSDTDVGAGAGPDVAGAPSIGERVLSPVARKVIGWVRELYPSRHLDRLHQQLLYAGLSTSIRAEEFATVQVVVAGVALLGAIVLSAASDISVRPRIVLALLMIFCAVMAPQAWLARRVRERTTALERELPDVLDLLTIAVESGLGLEQAMEAACSNFDSAMAEEMSRTLQEMSLGLSRQDAFNNLKERSESTDLASFVVVLTQADVLGMPIGRVLRTQADEMRERRRARAREKAAKLPVKILAPLMLCIFPPLIIIVIGPAAASIAKAFGL